MLTPVVPARMVERRYLPGSRVGGKSFVILGAIATLTGERQIVFDAVTFGAERDDVFDGKSFGSVSLLTETVFATSLRAFPDEKLQFPGRAFPSHAGAA